MSDVRALIVHWHTRYLLSLAPLTALLGMYFLAEWVFHALGCSTYGKEFLPCFVLGIDISVLLWVGMYLGQLLIPVAWFVSIPWLVWVALSHLEEWWKAKRQNSQGN